MRKRAFLCLMRLRAVGYFDRNPLLSATISFRESANRHAALSASVTEVATSIMQKPGAYYIKEV
jgi:hypothetical protein